MKFIRGLFLAFFFIGFGAYGSPAPDSAQILAKLPELFAIIGERMAFLANDGEKLDCHDASNVQRQLRALYTRNQYKVCTETAEHCEKTAPDAFASSPWPALWTADCWNWREQKKAAEVYYKKAIAKRFSQLPDHLAIELHAMRYLKDPFAERNLKEIEASVLAKIDDGKLPLSYRVELFRVMLVAYANAFEFKKSLAFSTNHLDLFAANEHFSRIWQPLYFSLMSDSSFPMEHAGKLYTVVLPYLSREGYLPTDRNSYTYPEMYSGICKDHLLPLQFSEFLRDVSKDWDSGRYSPDETLLTLLNLERKHPAKADLLTLKGSVQMALGKMEEAEESFWKAHEACPYYNRAHAGIEAIHSRKQNLASDSFQKFLREAKALEKGDVSELAALFPSYNSLSEEEKRLLQRHFKFWMPFAEVMRANGLRVYLKPVDRRVSQAYPAAKKIKDNERVSYRRLLDDIGGHARDGEAVVDRTVLYTQDPTIAHEIAHLMEKKLDKLCLSGLYQQASQREAFVSPYAARRNEFFATSVGTYLRMPAYMKSKDRDMFQYIRNVEEARGDLAKIRCPLKAPLVAN